MTESCTFSPNWVSAPGETIEDLLEERGWSAHDLARRMDEPPPIILGLLEGRIKIDERLANKLSDVLGSSPEFWLKRELNYQADLERYVTKGEEAPHLIEWIRDIPYAWMAKRKWVPATRKRVEKIKEAFRFFNICSLEDYEDSFSTPVAAFRSSTSFDKKVGPVSTWLRAARISASYVDTKPYDAAGFEASMVRVRALTKTTPEEFVPKVTNICAQHGVAVVFIPCPKGCPVNGATLWESDSKAILALSLRHKTNDHLWFAFFHEACHILRHKRQLLIEGLCKEDEDLEAEANAFAASILVPPASAASLPYLRTEVSVRAFACQIGVAPGIVVGQMQHKGLIKYSYMNHLKEKYEWSNG